MMKNHIKTFLIGLLILSLTATSVLGTTPQTIKITGRLQTNADVPITSSTEVTYRIYDNQTAGNAVYNKTTTVTPNSDGYYNILLDNLDNITFDGEYSVAVKIDNDAEMSRVSLPSTAYSFRAEYADNLSTTGTYTTNNLTTNYLYVDIDVLENTSFDSGTFFVDADGDKIGIGTTSPTAKLDVYNGAIHVTGTATPTAPTLTGLELIYDADGSISSGSGGTGVAYVQAYNRTASTSKQLRLGGSTIGFFVNDALSGAWDADGLGIGSTDPDVELVLKGDQNTTSTTYEAIMKFIDNNGATFGVLSRDYDGSNQWFGIQAGGNNLILNEFGGNVGIGTTTPGAKLHVVGTTNVTGIADFYNDVDIYNAGSVNDFTIRNTGGTQVIQMGADGSNGVIRLINSSSAVNILFDTDSDSYIINNNFGVGTGSPATKLEVEDGTILADYNTGTGYAFQVDYDATPTTYVGQIEKSAGTQNFRFLDNGQSTGSFWLYRNEAAATTAGPVVFIEQDEATDDQPTLKIQQDAQTNALLLPINNNATKPTLAFGDGDSGFYESTDDNLQIGIAGTNTWQISSTAFYSANANGAIIINGAASGTNPTIRPDRSDTNTGIGLSSGDQLSIITGGVENSRHRYVGGNTTNIFGLSVGRGSATYPTIGFGDGDSGFYEYTDDGLGLGMAGSLVWIFEAGQMGANTGGGGALLPETATGTNPTLIPYRTDGDTGIGGSGSNTVSLVAGGTEAVRGSSLGLNLTTSKLYTATNQIFDEGGSNILIGDVDSAGTSKSVGLRTTGITRYLADDAGGQTWYDTAGNPDMTLSDAGNINLTTSGAKFYFDNGAYITTNSTCLILNSPDGTGQLNVCNT